MRNGETAAASSIIKAVSAATYAAAADHFDGPALSFWDRFGRQTVARIGLRPADRVLDACCGTGASALPAAHIVGSAGQVLGFDLAEPALVLARAKAHAQGLTNVEFRAVDVDRTGLPSASFDAVVCVFGIFFLPDMPAAVAELWRLVRPGGVLAITVWGPGFLEPATTAFWAAVGAARPDLVGGFHPWTHITDTAALSQLFLQAGAAAPTVEAEPGTHPLADPEDWWSIVQGTGYRATIQQLDPAAARRARAANIAWLREHQVRQLQTNVVYARARKATLWSCPARAPVPARIRESVPGSVFFPPVPALLGMEPLTAVTVLAGQYGLQQLIRALGGDPGLVDLASQLVGALSASEDRLSQRLASIEQRLDEVLQQRYTIAIDTGLRTLLDAGTAASPAVRTDELLRARDLFREAAAAAGSNLQGALAERYLLLCAFALNRDDAARTALARISVAAFETVLESADAFGGTASLARAEERISREGGNRWQRNRRVRDEQAAIRAAATEAAELAVQLLRETGVLAQRLGFAAPPDVVKAADQIGSSERLGLWNVSGAGNLLRIGPLEVQWHRVELVKPATPSKPATPAKPLWPGTGLLPRPADPNTSPWPRRVAFPAPAPAVDVLHVDVEVRSDPGVTRAIQVRLASPPSWQTPLDVLLSSSTLVRPIMPARTANATLTAGSRSVRLQRQSSSQAQTSITPLASPARWGMLDATPRSARLIIDGVFSVGSPPVGDPTATAR